MLKVAAMRHKLILHGSGYRLWAQCSCEGPGDYGHVWYWLGSDTLLKGRARRAVIAAEYARHLRQAAV